MISLSRLYAGDWLFCCSRSSLSSSCSTLIPYGLLYACSPHAAQRQPPHALVLLAQLRLANAHNLPVDVLLLVVALRQRGLPVPQVVQPRLPQQREVEAAEPQVRQPLQPVLPEVLQARVERGHGARLLHDHEATREAARRAVRAAAACSPSRCRA